VTYLSHYNQDGRIPGIRSPRPRVKIKAVRRYTTDAHHVAMAAVHRADVLLSRRGEKERRAASVTFKAASVLATAIPAAPALRPGPPPLLDEAIAEKNTCQQRS